MTPRESGSVTSTGWVSGNDIACRGTSAVKLSKAVWVEEPPSPMFATKLVRGVGFRYPRSRQ